MLDGIVKAVEILGKKRRDSETEKPELPVKIVTPKEVPAAPAPVAAPEKKETEK